MRLLTLRRRLLFSVLGALALALAVLIGAFNVVLRERLNHEAAAALSARAAAVLSSLRVAGGRIAVAEAPDAGAPDALSWVFAADGRVLEQPRADPTIERAAAQLARVGHGSVDPGGAAVRLYAVPVAADGRRLGAVVTAISLAAYQASGQTALVGSLVLGLLLLMAAAVGARMLIAGALRPVGQMTAQAATWSEIESGQRFGLGPPRDELTALAATLDALLDRVANSLRHEQRFSAELSHELRSPLASVVAEAQLALRHAHDPEQHRRAYERILASAKQMQRTLEALLAAARVEHGRALSVGDASAAAHAAAEGCAPLAAAHGVRITVQEPAGDLTVGVETEVAERVLSPLIENACRYGASLVRIGLGRSDGAVIFTVDDDGAGIPVAVGDRVFEPGWSGDAGNRGARGAGLGLPLARRLARAAGGEVYAEASGSGGRFIARLPAA